MHDTNIIAWSIMIIGYIQNRFSKKYPKTCIKNMEEYTRPKNYLTRCIVKKKNSWSIIIVGNAQNVFYKMS